MESSDPTYNENIAIAQNGFNNVLSALNPSSADIGRGLIFDDSAWKLPKKYIPEYAVFDTLYSHPVGHYTN